MVTIKNLGRALSLIPVKYYLSATGAVIVLLGYGIGKTITTPIATPVAVTAESKPPSSLLNTPPQAAIPAAIGEGNIFRRQRTDYQLPPPPPPLQPADPNEPVPDIKLLGIIITDTKKLAILDAELKRYIRKEVPEALVLSGMKQVPLNDDGRYYETVAVKGDKLASQTFYEGDIVSEYRLSRVDDSSIEVASLASGRKTTIYLDTDIAANALSGRMAKANSVMGNFDRKYPLNTSGSVTK